MDFLKKHKHIFIFNYVIIALACLISTDSMEGNPSLQFELIYALLWPVRFIIWIFAEAIWSIIYSCLEVINYTMSP